MDKNNSLIFLNIFLLANKLGKTIVWYFLNLYCKVHIHLYGWCLILKKEDILQDNKKFFIKNERLSFVGY